MPGSTTYRTPDGTTVRTWPSPTPGRTLVQWTLPSGYGGGTEADTEAEALRVARAHVDAARLAQVTREERTDGC